MIGAGLAGITAGALLPAKVPDIQLTILEKNPEVVCQIFRPVLSNIHSNSFLPDLGGRAVQRKLWLTYLTLIRAVHGSRTDTPVYAVTSPRTSTKPVLLRTLNGARNMLKAPRSSPTGRVLQPNMGSTTRFDSTAKS